VKTAVAKQVSARLPAIMSAGFSSFKEQFGGKLALTLLCNKEEPGENSKDFWSCLDPVK
jgi:hypothetical protein